jgi:hypothetical protein
MPAEVIDLYAQRAKGSTIVDEWRASYPGNVDSLTGKLRGKWSGLAASMLRGGCLRFSSPFVSMLGYVDKDKRNIGVLAFRNSAGGGCDYFLSKMEGVAPAFTADKNGDVPGRDIAEVPRPPFSRRLLSLERVDENPGVYLCYEGAGSPSGIIRFYRTEMPKGGWREAIDIDEIREIPKKDKFLYFEKERSGCIVKVEDRGWRKVLTTMLYMPAPGR